MKKKRPANSKDPPSNKKKRQSTSDSELVHEFIESLSDKIDNFKAVINDSELTDPDSMKEGTELEQFHQFLKDLSIEESLKQQHSSSSSETRFISFELGEEAATEGASGAGTEAKRQYRFQFTNSEFLAFLAALDPVEYLIVITLLAILISVNFNTEELEVIYSFLNNLSDSISTIVEQEVFQKTLAEEKAAEEKNTALQTNFTHLNNQIAQLQEKIKELEAKLNES